MITCKTFGDKVFSSKKELYAELVAKKDELIAIKKSAIKFSDGLAGIMKSETAKGGDGQLLTIGDTITTAINTVGYLDSHEDVHLKGNWNKSAMEQSGKTYHVINHDLSIGNIVGYPKDVTISVQTKSWRELGYNKDGYTEVLAFTTKMTDKTNKDAFLAYRDNEPIQHSIRMSYIKLLLAINDPEMKEEYANYLSYKDEVVNQDALEEKGFFWGVLEAKIEKEGSTVLFGSNNITPYMGINSTFEQPPTSTVIEPQKFDVSVAIKNVNFFN